MFGNKKGSLNERRRGTRKAFTSSAQLKRFRLNNSTMQGSPQMSSHGMPGFASAHGDGMIQCLSKFFGERSGVKRRVNLRVVIKVNIDVPLARRVFPIGDELCVFGLLPFAPVFDPVRPPIELRIAVTANVKLLRSVQTAV